MVSSLAVHTEIQTTDSNPSDSTGEGLDLVAKVGIYWRLKCLDLPRAGRYDIDLRKTQAPHDQEMEVKITCVTYNITGELNNALGLACIRSSKF